jgi:tetratricopeptide (TPR) repeat protein
MPPQCVHPEADRDAIAALRVAASEVDRHALRGYVAGEASSIDPEDGRLRRALATHVAQARSVHAIGMHLLMRDEWDCMMIFHDLIDALGHHFMEHSPPRMRHIPLERFNRFSGVMAAAYCEQDRMLGEMLAAAGPDTTVIILSDHGFHSGESRPVMSGPAMTGDRLDAEAMWHRPIGMLAMAGPGIKAGAAPAHPGLLDIAPTAMALMGVAAGEDMPGRVLAESLAGSPPARVGSWDDIAGDAGMHPPDARQDPFEQHAAIQQLVELGYMQALPEGVQARIEHVRRECQFNLAVTLSTTGRLGDAIPVFQSLLDASPDNVRYALSLADCLHRAGRFEECAAAVRPMLPQDKDDRPLHLTMAIALTFAGRFEEAATVTDGLRSDDADGCAGIGDLCVMQRRADAAERWYRRALKLNGRHWRSHAGLAQAALLRDRLEACANHCMDAAGIDPQAWTPHYLLGVALAWYGDLPNALQSFRLAAQINPCSRTLHRYLSLVHREMGNAEAAARTAAEAERLGAMLNRATDLLATMPRTPEEWEAKLDAGASGSPRG